MRSLTILCVLSLSLFVTACSTSSPSTMLQESPQLQAAEAKVDQAVNQLPPPARLLTCQDGSDPKLLEGKWECPPPPDLVQALQSGPTLQQRALLIEKLRVETDLRFQLLHFRDKDGSPAQPAPSPSP